jgi:xanthine dehydrogenase accessory factor
VSRELRSIVERFDALAGANGRAVIATVIDVRGSSYRSPGARMLVEEDGTTRGTLSGGCLEADLLERAKRVLHTGAPEVFVYDTGSTDDSVFGLNMGCRGVIRILLEPAETTVLGFLRRRLSSSHGAAVATVVGDGGSGTFVNVGGRALVDERGASASGVGADVEAALVAACRAAIRDERSRWHTAEFGEVFVEYISPPVPLVVCGAGHDAVPLARLANELGWRVTVVDHRPAYATRDRFPAADELFVVRPEAAATRLAIDARTAVVLMTHNYAHDLELLRFLLPSPAPYVGLLGPKARTDRLLADLAASGHAPAPHETERLHAPVGIDIGAEAPEEIALAILAEIRAVLAGRRGGKLRDRAGAIHDRDGENERETPQPGEPTAGVTGAA